MPRCVSLSFMANFVATINGTNKVLLPFTIPLLCSISEDSLNINLNWPLDMSKGKVTIGGCD